MAADATSPAFRRWSCGVDARVMWKGLWAAALVVCAPTDARAACTPDCVPAVVVPSDGVIPANLPGLIYQPSSRSRLPPRLLRVVAGSETLVASQLKTVEGVELLVPTGGWQSGATYRVRSPNPCPRSGDPQRQADLLGSVQVGPAVPPPTRIGDFSVQPVRTLELDVESDAPSCTSSATVAAQVVKLRPAPDLAPWLRAAWVTTWVDGEIWTGLAHRGEVRTPGGGRTGRRGEDLVFAVCASQDPDILRETPPGEHSVTMHIAVPGAFAMETETLALHLDCSAEPDEDTIVVEPPDAPPPPHGVQRIDVSNTRSPGPTLGSAPVGGGLRPQRP